MSFSKWGRWFLLAMLASFLVPALSTFILPVATNSRNWHYPLVILLLIVVFVARPPLEEWFAEKLSRRFLVGAFIVIASGFILSNILHYWALKLNAIDFSVFDYMLYNSHSGSWGFSPFCQCNHFGVHSHWWLLPLGVLHRLWSSHYLLVFVHGLAVALAAVPLFAFCRSRELGDVLSLLVVFAFLGGKWVGGISNYGFHPEVFYLPVGFSFLFFWFGRRGVGLWVSFALMLFIKEDAAIYLALFSVANLVGQRSTRRASAVILVLSLVYFFLYQRFLQPFLLAEAQPSFVSFWAGKGDSVGAVMLHFLTAPWELLLGLWQSAWFLLLAPFAFLPLRQPAIACVLLGTLVLHGSSSNVQLQNLSLYYSAPVLPFLFVGLVLAVERYRQTWLRYRGGATALLLMLLCAPLWGGGYLRFPSARWYTLNALSAVQQSIPLRPGETCVQGSLLTHFNYELSPSLLNEGCVRAGKRFLILSDYTNTYPLAEVLPSKLAELNGYRSFWRVGEVQVMLKLDDLHLK